MDAKTVIDSYTNTVARRLPRQMRNEVGLELRAILADALNTAAAETNREPDGALALEVLRKLGRPDVVAARYAPTGFSVIEPEHGPWFVKLAAACVVVQWALTLPLVFTSALTPGEWWLGWGVGAFWWIGALTIWFAAAGWAQRRWPLDPHNFVRPWQQYMFWVPSMRDWLPQAEPEEILYSRGVHRVVVLVLFALLAVLLSSPAWLPSVGVDASWMRYDAAFQQGLFWPLLALMAVRLALYALAVFNERWRARTELLRFGLWVGFVGVLTWALVAGAIFASPTADLAFKAWLSVFLLVNAIAIAAHVHRVRTSVRLPKTLYRGG